ncbi:MAG: FAD-dependent pyridine nucleotide-disulfide oxidoreductase [Acidobacteriota bacterium]|nr:FAD-dependent pyridine nucleotide-disulfide oxidoreductase [Acidobacteriota bacterium]
MNHVIIGAGIAGVTAAQAIKETDNDADVVLIGKEDFAPYKRCQLTEFLCDLRTKTDLTFAPVESLKEMGIKFRRGQTARSINTTEKWVQLDDDEILYYDRLLIATGGQPNLGHTLRPFLKHIQRYYSLKDVVVLKKKMADIRKCIVFGEGFSCLDLLSGLYNLGKDVTFITRRERVELPLADSEFNNGLQEFLEDTGIEIITGSQVTSISKFRSHYRVMTSKHGDFYGDIVFAWDQYRPYTACIKGTNIEKKAGILVNERLETSVKDIYAAGDCAQIFHPVLNDYWINFGWPNAREQGEIAGKNMAGGNEEYKIHEVLAFNIMGKELKARWWE